VSTVAVTRLIAAPVARVWAVFTDLPARSGWLSTVDDIQVLTAGPFGAGTGWQETRTMPDGAKVTEEFQVTQCTVPACFVVTSPGIGADYRMTYTFIPIKSGRRKGGTAVTAVQDGALTAPVARLLALVFGGLAARTVEGALRQDLDALAVAATAGSTDGPANAA